MLKTDSNSAAGRRGLETRLNEPPSDSDKTQLALETTVKISS